MYLWRAVDAEGEVLDVLLQAKRDQRAAQKLMRKLLKRQGMAPDEWVTDKCPAYGAALRELKLTRAPHTRRKRANNRAESSHVPVRRRDTCLCGGEKGNYKGSNRPDQPSGSCPCTRPPTTSLPFLVTSSLLARTGSSEPRRLRHGGVLPVSAPDMDRPAAYRVHCPQRDNASWPVTRRSRRSSWTSCATGWPRQACPPARAACRGSSSVIGSPVKRGGPRG